MRSLERVNIRTNVRTYVLTYIRTGQTLYPLHNFVVQGDNNWGRNVLGAKMTRGRSFGGAEVTGVEMVWGRSV